jgi:hypothetical protein
MTSKKFYIGDLISVTTGFLVSPNHIDGVYAVVDHLFGVQHFTHQLPDASRKAEPLLQRQHPWLKKIAVPTNLRSEKAVAEWLAPVAAQYGEFHQVKSVSS